MLKNRILNLIEQLGRATSDDIADELGLDATKVTKYLTKLRRELGIVYVVGHIAGETGRPRNVWALCLNQGN